MQVQIRGQVFRALIDSGSQVNLVSEGALSQTNLLSAMKRKNIPAASWACDNLAFTGTITLPLTLADTDYKIKAYTCEHLATNTDLILGLEFLQQNQVALAFDPEGVRLWVKDQEVNLTPTGKVIDHLQKQLQVYNTETNNNKLEAVVAKRVKIPSQCCKSIKVNLPENRKWGEDVHITGRSFVNEDQDWELPSQIASVKKLPGNTVFAFVVLYNAADLELTLDKGYKMCDVEEIEQRPLVNFIRTASKNKHPCGAWSNDWGVEPEPDEDLEHPPSEPGNLMDSGVVSEGSDVLTMEER